MARGSDDTGGSLARAVRLDLVIAVCALLISTLATGASWWQARVLAAQTQVLQQQLGAQVWPYVSFSTNVHGNTVEIALGNDGLGPAVLRSEAVYLDGKPEDSFVEVMHAILGPNIVARARKAHTKIHLDLNGGSPGSVLRAGQSTVAFAFESEHFASAFARATARLSYRTCYCAIIPGKCWMTDSASSNDPQPVSACVENRNDLMHSSPLDQLDHTF